MYTSKEFIADLECPYAWPGGYPRFFITSDCASLSFAAAIANKNQIIDAINEQSNCGWRIIACDINWEDAALFCDHTGKRIESAYAEDEAQLV